MILLLFVFAANNIQAQFTRIDSTLKIGKVGYRVKCSNRSAEKNELSIKPEGFDNAAREMDFYIKGRIAKVEIDDLNNDSYPDLIVYFYTGEEGIIGMVYAFMSAEKQINYTRCIARCAA